MGLGAIRRHHDSRFNPRPPLLAGEWAWRNKSDVPMAVSIHARHCWRANGDALANIDDWSAVSIHARHCWRANGFLSIEPMLGPVFQSTPAIAGGRMPRTPPSPPRAAACFNPRPPLLAGEWVTSHLTHFYTSFQSTPAIAGGRMVMSAHLASQVGGFNPRPPLLAGEWAGADLAGFVHLVSIHARHCWRANAEIAAHNAAVDAFQSTPAIAGGRMALVGGRVRGLEAFQSTPAIAGGRMQVIWSLMQVLEAVSIHARHCWRANGPRCCR